MEKYIKKFSETGIGDISVVGGKNASLGEMFNNLMRKGVPIPNGFAVTVFAYKHFLEYNAIAESLRQLIHNLDTKEFSNLEETGKKARKLITDSTFPQDLENEIIEVYDNLFEQPNQEVAVRSSATAEDLADASFAGLHDSYLNIKGHYALIYAIKCCFASLYTDRAIKYREDRHYNHQSVFLSVGVQQMVRSDLGCSGIGFTLEPESGFKEVIHLAGTWGLGENIVQGLITPDEFLLFKPSLRNNKKAILQKNLGAKNRMLVYNDNAIGTYSTYNKVTPYELQEKFVLNDNEIQTLGHWALVIEEHYGKPMDFEWAKDGLTNELYIIQARPETVHSSSKSLRLTTYHLNTKGIVLVSGKAIGAAIAIGHARKLSSPTESYKLVKGDILITDTTSPDWDIILKKVSGVVTNKGGRTSHASIVARELGVVAIVGTGNATEVIQDGQLITLSCSEGKTGYVYQGEISYSIDTTDLTELKLPEKPKVQFILGEPEKAFQLSFYPNHGVGLLRLEFIINNYVKIHPMALLKPALVTDEKKRALLENYTKLYPDKEHYFIDKLSQGVATIAAAFYPKEIIVRMSDFKSNEYSGLFGGSYFEPKEENPMLGFRGASRYYHEKYREGFRLECEAMKVVRNEMGFTNVKLMIPFCRTVEEGKKVITLMKQYGLQQHENGLEIYVMAEIPANILLAEAFAKVFDGFSIGSNDLTQLTLGVDRDSELISDLFDEENQATLQLITQMIKTAKSLNKKVGICGQAVSDSESFIKLLVHEEIDSISFNPDALIKGISIINQIL